MLFLEKISILVGHIYKSISYRAWKVILFPHSELVRSSAMGRYDKGKNIEERLIRTLKTRPMKKD